MEKSVNHFFGGINTDKHVEMRDQNVTLQNELFDVMDVDGHGLINTSLMGNDYDETVDSERGFKLTNGFTPTGEFTYKGITFIFSQKTSTNQFEIGTFPSPKYDGTPGFSNIYKPLNNYLGANNPLVYQQLNQMNDPGYQAAIAGLRTPFRISAANAYPWNIGERPMQITGRLNFDNSVNLYIADGENPLRVINCGFDVFTGLYTKKAYSDIMFKHAINVLNETDAPVRLFNNGVIKEVEIGYAGKFKCGNVQMYFRYSDEDFNPTSYQSHSGMVSIIPSNEQATTNPHSFSGGAGDKETNKSIKLFIDLSANRIDLAYKYLEIAYIRHYEAGAMESFRIDKKWEIQDLIAQSGGAGWIEIEITNYETLIAVTPAEIIKQKRRDTIPLDVTTIEDRLWAGNLKVADYDPKTLYDFAQTITLTPVKRQLNDKPAPSTGVGFADIGYKNYQNVYHYAQYLCGEVYAYGVQFLLKNTGTWSESFPVQGEDWYSGAASGTPNTKGIFRFPSMQAGPVIIHRDYFSINGIKFNVPATAGLVNLATAIRFTRVERKKNLLYQGVICKSFCSHSDPSWGNYAGAQDFAIPALWQHFPYAYHKNGECSTGFPKLTDGRAYTYFANNRCFPSPFNIEADSSNVNNGSTFGSDTIDVNAHFDPYNYIEGVHKYFSGLKSKMWMRCDVPFRLFMNSREGNDNIDIPDDERNSILHWERISMNATVVNTPGYNKSTVTLVDTELKGRIWQGVSFKGDFEGWHRGPVNTIPGWAKGYWGIFSVDFAIKKQLNESSYFIKKIGEYDSANTNTARAGVDKIYRYTNGTQYSHNPGGDLAAINRIMMDFEKWLTTPLKPSRWNGGAYDFGSVYVAELSKIAEWQVMPNKQFASYFAEGTGDAYNGPNQGDDDNEDDTADAIDQQIYIDRTNADFHFYYFSQKNKRDGRNGGQLEIKNLEFAIAPYIGVDFTSLGDLFQQPMFWNNDLVCVYLKNPDSGFDIEDWYNPGSEQYFPITQHLYLDEVNATSVDAYRGDSFPAHAYMKTMINPKYNPMARDDKYDGYIAQGSNHPSFGQLLGYAAEHTCNTGFRHSEDILTANLVDELDYETFYPGLDPQTPYNYAHQNRARESFRYNDGYSKQLSVSVSPGFDVQIPFREEHYQCRIMYSAKQTDEAIQDSWRDIGATSYKDFEGAHGNLVRIFGSAGKLYSFYDHGVKAHPVNELVQQATSAGIIVVGQQAETLPDKAGSISDTYGIQGTKALGSSDYFIYGFDYNKRAILAIPKGGTDLKVISITEGIEKLIYSDIESAQQLSDVRFGIDNMPTYYEGVSIGYNRKYKRVYISYRKTKQLASSRQTLYSKTVIFNEKVGKFTGTMNFYCPMFISINEDFYGFNYENIGAGNEKKFWLWDQEKTLAGNNNYNTFFGGQYPSWFEIVSCQNSSIAKVFDNIHIQMNQQDILSIEYTTQYQTAIHAPFNVNGITPIYIKPKYRENKWELAIKRADTASGSFYAPGSIMRGNHLRIKVNFFTQNPIFAKSILTGFRYSMH